MRTIIIMGTVAITENIIITPLIITDGHIRTDITGTNIISRTAGTTKARIIIGIIITSAIIINVITIRENGTNMIRTGGIITNGTIGIEATADMIIEKALPRA